MTEGNKETSIIFDKKKRLFTYWIVSGDEGKGLSAVYKYFSAPWKTSRLTLAIILALLTSI